MNAGISARRSGVYDSVLGDISCRDLNFLTLDGGSVDTNELQASRVDADEFQVADTSPVFSIPRPILSNYGPRYNTEMSAALPCILLANGVGPNVGFYLEKPLTVYVPGQMIEYLWEGTVVATATQNLVIGPWFDTTAPVNDGPVNGVVIIAGATLQAFSLRMTITIVGVQTATIDYNYSSVLTLTASGSSSTEVVAGEYTAVGYDVVTPNPSTVFTTIAASVGSLIGSDTITVTTSTALVRLIAGSTGFVLPS